MKRLKMTIKALEKAKTVEIELEEFLIDDGHRLTITDKSSLEGALTTLRGLTPRST